MFKFNVIIATYNSDKTLKQTFDSIRYQTYKNIETIIVDGLSSDKTVEIIKNYDDVISKWISEKDTGIYNAFNKGLFMATGDYVCFIGSDDCYCDYDVFANVEKVLEHNEVNVLSNPIISINTNNMEKIISNKITTEDILAGCMLPHPGLFVRTDIMKMYKFNEENKIISDYEFLFRYILDGGDIFRGEFPVAYFSDGGLSNSISGSKMWEKRLQEHLRLYQHTNIDFEYEVKFLKRWFGYDCANGNISVYLLKQFISYLLKTFHLFDYIQVWRGKERKHTCNLRYCRWCKRK